MRNGSRPKHVVLVGLSGSGKSTVGPLLAQRLGRPFVDTDALIEAEAGKPIPSIFVELGEPAFREIERLAVTRATSGPPAVIATGGGAPVPAQNRALLWRDNLVVWLDARVETLVGRLGAGDAGRPLLAGDPAAHLAGLRASRAEIYGTAHLRIETDEVMPEIVADRIMNALAGYASVARGRVPRSGRPAGDKPPRYRRTAAADQQQAAAEWSERHDGDD